MSADRKATKPAHRAKPNAAGKGSEIGARVAALRARAGLTQGDVAARLGMSQRLLSYYEREASDIPASMLVPLADVLGVEVCWLLGIAGERVPPKDRSQPTASQCSGQVALNVAGKKPGPKPAASCAMLRKQAGRGYLQERFEAVREMPRKDQQFVVKFLDQVLEDYARRKRRKTPQAGG
jgi:transcriptional regulator with XRE-family HTH domain